MADTLGIDPLSILQALVGSVQNITQNTNVANTGTTAVTGGQTANQTQNVDSTKTGTTNSSQSGTSATNTSGTSNTSNTSQTGTASQQANTVNTASNTSQTGSQTGTTQQTTQNNANVLALQQILEQQQRGMSADALQALFRVGAEGAPALTAQYANAVGARTSNNSPLAVSLEGMMSKIMQQAALGQQSALAAAADTASKIAQLTSSQVTSGNTAATTTQSGVQTGTQQGSQTATSSQNQTGTQSTTSQQAQTGSQQASGTTNTSELLSQLVNSLTNQTNNQTTTNNTNQATTGTTQNATNVNDARVMDLLGLLLGGNILSSGLTGAGFNGISGAVGSATSGAGSLLTDLLKSIGVTGTADPTYWNGGATSTMPTGTTTDNIDQLLNQWLSGSPVGSLTSGITVNDVTNTDAALPPDFWSGLGGP